MCTGRVDLDHVLRAYANGMDGVFIGGCRLNECNYITQGNYHALTMALLSRRIIEHLGLNPERLSIEFMSAGEGVHFAEAINGFATKVRALGPVCKAEGIDRGEFSSRLAEVRKLVPYIKLELNDKLATRLTNQDEYDQFFTKEEVDSLVRNVVSYYIDPGKCTACMICARRCPVQAIASGKGQVHVIDQEQCIKCNTCFEVCPSRFGAVTKLSGEPVPPPLPADQRAIARKVEEVA